MPWVVSHLQTHTHTHTDAQHGGLLDGANGACMQTQPKARMWWFVLVDCSSSIRRPWVPASYLSIYLSISSIYVYLPSHVVYRATAPYSRAVWEWVERQEAGGRDVERQACLAFRGHLNSVPLQFRTAHAANHTPNCNTATTATAAPRLPDGGREPQRQLRLRCGLEFRCVRIRDECTAHRHGQVKAVGRVGRKGGEHGCAGGSDDGVDGGGDGGLDVQTGGVVVPVRTNVVDGRP